MFNLSKGEEDGALALIDKVYHESQDRQTILHELKKQVKKKDDKNESGQTSGYCQ